MNYVFLISLLVLINTANSKPTSQDDYDPNDMAYEDDQNMQKDDYADEYEDGDSVNNNYDDDDPIPVIVSKAEHLIVKPHMNVTLPCALEKRELFVLLWKRDETIIFQDTISLGNVNYKYVLQDNSSLVIRDVEEADDGDYTCEIAMSNGPKLTHSITVGKPAKILSLSADRSVTEYKVGDPLVLTCNATGTPEPTYTWSMQGKRFNAKGSTLIFEKIHVDNAGVYQCLAENDMGPPAHQSITIVINHKPIAKIEKLIQNINGDSYDAELRCLIRSATPPIIKWEKNGQDLAKHQVKPKMKNKSYAILIKNVDESKLGKYTCSVENQMGKVEQHYLLTNAPSKPIYYNGEYSTNRRDVILMWEVDSVFPISRHMLFYKINSEPEWKKAEPEVGDSTSYIYHIKHTLTALHDGEYEVKVQSQNKFGWSENSTITTFRVPQNEHNQHPTHPTRVEDPVLSHNGHKQHPTHPTSNEVEHNNFETPPEPAVETRGGTEEASSSAMIFKTTSLMWIVILFLFNRH